MHISEVILWHGFSKRYQEMRIGIYNAQIKQRNNGLMLPIPPGRNKKCGVFGLLNPQNGLSNSWE